LNYVWDLVLQRCRADGAGFAADRPANPVARIFIGTANDSPASKWRFGRPPHTSRSFSDGGALTSCRYAIWTGGIRFLLAGLVSHC